MYQMKKLTILIFFARPKQSKRQARRAYYSPSPRKPRRISRDFKRSFIVNTNGYQTKKLANRILFARPPQSERQNYYNYIY